MPRTVIILNKYITEIYYDTELYFCKIIGDR
jgi:hypothetical protein